MTQSAFVTFVVVGGLFGLFIGEFIMAMIIHVAEKNGRDTWPLLKKFLLLRFIGLVVIIPSIYFGRGFLAE